MLAGIIMTTARMIPMFTLVAGMGILVGMVSLAVYGAVASRRAESTVVVGAAENAN